MLTTILAITMLIATCSTAAVALDIPYDADDFSSDGREVVKVTDAKIVADYDYYSSFLSDMESSILSCNAIVGNSHVIPVPADSDELISIDPESYTVTADTFTSGDYTWKPVKAYLVYTDSANEEFRSEIALDENGKGSFDTDLESYSIEVDYEVEVAIDLDAQRELVNAPAVLVNGVASMNAVAACGGDLETIASEAIFSQLLMLTTPVSGVILFDKGKGDDRGYDAVMALKAHRDANNGTFAINNSIDAYKAADNKVAYIVENGSELKNELEAVEHIISLSQALNDKMPIIDAFNQTTNKLIDDETHEKLSSANGILSAIAKELEKGSVSDWEAASDVVSADATDLELEALNLAVSAALGVDGSVSRHDSEELVEAPVAAKTTVKAGVAQNAVTVTINAQVIGSNTVDSNDLSTLAGIKGNFLIKAGATDAEINEKISALNLCQEALAHWANSASVYNIGTEFYAPETVYDRDDATGDINVTITYMPKIFTVSKEYADTSDVYYGYNLRLEVHEDASKSYDYTVNGTAKYQGEIIKVAEDISISRKEGTALRSDTVSSMIADSSVGTFLSDEARAVLKANAFKTSEYASLFATIRFRDPSNATFIETEEENGYKAIAPSIASGLLSGAEWKAVSVDLLDNDGTILATFPIDEDGFVFDGAFSNARINYELSLDVDAEDVRTLANLPHVLSVEAGEQIKILDRMANGNLYSALGSIGDKLNLVSIVVKGSDMSQEAKDAVALLNDECVDAAGNIKLYSYLTAYKAAANKGGAEGLKYYYTASNAANIKYQLDVLSNAFNAICPADETDPDRIELVGLLEENNYADYVKKLDSIRESLDECKSIAPVNEYVDTTNSQSLGALASAIYNAIGKTKEYSGDGVAIYSGSVICAAPDKSTVKVVINVQNGDGSTSSYTDTVTLKKGATVGDTIKNKIEELDGKLTINKNFYTVTGWDSIPEGDVVIDSITSDIVITYAPYSYTVSVPGTPDQVFFYDTDWSVVLPASPNNSIKLVYTIGVGGETVEVVQTDVVFTFGSLDLFDENRSLPITVEEVDLDNEKILNFANLLNSALTGTGASLIPVQDGDGEIVMILRTPAGMSSESMTDIATNLTLALAMYDDVALGGSVLWDGSRIHLQSMIDMVANSGFSLDLLVSVIREDGTVINDAELSKLTPMIDVEGNVGGKLMVSTITLDDRTMSFYVTLSDQTPAEELAKTRRAMVDLMRDYVKLECKDGKFQFVLTAPDSIYPYYLTQMLLADKVDITDITKLNLKDSIAYEWSLLEDLLCDETLSMETFENTLSMLGKDADLSYYVNILNSFKNGRKYLADHATVTSYETASDEYAGTFTLDLYSAFKKMSESAGISDTMMNFIYEATEGAEPFKVDFHFALSNIIDKDYDAIVFDLKGESLTKKFYCTNDLTSVLGNVGNNAIIVMTQDVTLTGDVYIPHNAIIDLNGFTLTGNLSTGGTVRIVDSRFDTEEAGTVDGVLGSGRFILTGGKYTTDVSAHLTNGYYVNENGYVRNRIYSLTKNGNDMEIALSAGYINNVGMVDFQAVLVDIAVDVAMTAYTGAAISVDGNYIYSFSLEDITGILSGGRADLVNSTIDILDTKGLSSIVNSVITKITDFNALADAINNNSALVDYELAIEHWDIVPYIADGNYITFDSVPSNKESGRFTVVIEGTSEEKAELATLCKNFSAVNVEKFEINVNDINYNDGFNVDFNGEVNVQVDLSKNRAYAALICAAAAYNTEDWAKRAVYKAALEEYLAGEGTDKIAQVIEGMTVAEFIATCKTIGSLSCETILEGIDVDVSDKTHGMISLFNSYSNLVRICDKVLTRLDITGNGSNLAGNKVENTYATYKFQTELVGRINVTLTITTVPSGKIIFDMPNIDISDSVVAESIKGFTGIEMAGGESGFAIDAAVDGISVESFLSMLNVNVDGAINATAAIYDADGNPKTAGLVCTGDTLVITAFDGVDDILKEYTVVIIGDSNGNGRADIGDSVKISNYFIYEEDAGMSEAQILACDLNGNGRVDIGDAVKLSVKFTADWEEYNSSYSSNN